MSSATPSLLTRLHRLLESSYRWDTGICELGGYILGDEGYRRLYGGEQILDSAPRTTPGPRTLIRTKGGEVRLAVYLPDRMVRFLEARNPLRVLDEENLAPFAALVEELDHLLRLAWCVRNGRQVRLLELEFHANVTKYLAAAHFLGRHSRRPRLSAEQRQWLGERLYAGEGDDLPRPEAERYRTAARLARLFVRYLETMPAPSRRGALPKVARWPWHSLRPCLESPDRARWLGLLLGA